MQGLIKKIEELREKLPELRKHSLKETPTRTIVIDVLLEALGWNVRDPNEVELEYPTIDGKAVDYALKINRKPILLVEAKALDDSLEDVKAITQVVGYAANNGITWCILTNGVKWRVYRSIENCPAPEKLMFEVNISPKKNEDLSSDQIATLMWRFSHEEMIRGTLDLLADQIFGDGKVRNALVELMTEPTNRFLKLIGDTVGDEKLSSQKIRESLSRIVKATQFETMAIGFFDNIGSDKVKSRILAISDNHEETSNSRKDSIKAKKYDEIHHTSGKSQEVVYLYRTLDNYCLSMKPENVSRKILAKYISYCAGKKCFCSVCLQQNGIRIYLPLKYDSLKNPPAFARDVSSVGHWGIGDVELRINSTSQLTECNDLIRYSFESKISGD